MSFKPLVVYLDSSDISVLSNPQTRTEELINIETELFALQNWGMIEFRFSHVHVLEAAPKDEKSIEYATQRFNYITTLCQGKCITSYVDILEHETLRISDQFEGGDFEIYNNESKW